MRPGDLLGNHGQRAIAMAVIFEPVLAYEDGMGVHAPPGIQDLDDLGKIGDRAGQPVDLLDDQGVDPSRGDIVEQLLQRRPIDRRAGEPDVIIHRAPAHPAFGPLAVDEGLANFALCLQRIEFRVEPFSEDLRV